MKLLIVITSLREIEPFIAHYSLQLSTDKSAPYLHTTKMLHHEVDILEAGAGLFQTGYKLTKALSRQKYHLTLRISLGNVYKPEIAVGSVLNIINEKPGDFGTGEGEAWQDLYDSGLLSREAEPQTRGGFVNLTNAYMNVFMPFKKSVGITVNHSGRVETVQARLEKYKADCETTDGIGFAYTCLFEKQVFYHLCTIQRNLATGETNNNLALQKLNETLIDLTAKL